MSKNIPSTSEENSINSLERCSTCKELIHESQLDPNYDGLLATYANQTYCTLKCMSEPEDNSQKIIES